MRNPEAESFVAHVWAAFEREGLAGVIALAAEDARWRPHSADGFEGTTAEYRDRLAALGPGDEIVRASSTTVWSHDDVVIVRGRLRVQRQGGALEDARMYWLFGVHGRELTRVASSPDLGELLRDAGRDDPVLVREAYRALQRGTADSG